MQRRALQEALEAFLNSEYQRAIRVQKRSSQIWHVCLYSDTSFSVVLLPKNAAVACLPLGTEMLGTIAEHSPEYLREMLSSTLLEAKIEMQAQVDLKTPTEVLTFDARSYIALRLQSEGKEVFFLESEIPSFYRERHYYNPDYYERYRLPERIVAKSMRQDPDDGWGQWMNRYEVSICKNAPWSAMTQSEAVQVVEEILIACQRAMEQMVAERTAQKEHYRSRPYSSGLCDHDNDYSMDSPLLAGGDSDSW